MNIFMNTYYVPGLILGPGTRIANKINTTPALILLTVLKVFTSFRSTHLKPLQLQSPQMTMFNGNFTEAFSGLDLGGDHADSYL